MRTPDTHRAPRWIPLLITLAIGVLLLAGGSCQETADDDSGDDDVSGDDDATDDDDTGDDDTGGELDITICAPDNGPFTLDIDNPYLPFQLGQIHVLEGLEGGVDEIRVQFAVLDETVEIDGVTTRVVEEREWEDGELADIERMLVVQAPDGTVCFYGVDGEWQAGEDDALAGILMPASPEVGMVFEMIHAPGHGMETVEISSMGDSVETPAGTFDDTVTILEPGPSVKKYARDIGMIYDDGIELTEY